MKGREKGDPIYLWHKLHNDVDRQWDKMYNKVNME